MPLSCGSTVFVAKTVPFLAVLQSTEESRHDAHSVSQIKDFVKKLGSLQTEKKALQVHINIAAAINKKTEAIDFGKTVQVEQALAAGEDANMCMEYIEEGTFRQVELLKLLRLSCLSSLTTNGMKTKNYESLKREMLQVSSGPAGRLDDRGCK